MREAQSRQSEMHEKMGEMHNIVTAMDLALEMRVTPERVGQLFRAFRDGKHPHFAGRFNRFAELSPIQVAALRGQDIAGMVDAKEETESAASFATPVAMTPEQGRPNEVAPQRKESGKNIKWGEVVALAIAFVLPTLASAFNTYNVSHQLSKNEWVALFVMCMVMLTPVLFIAARMDWTGVFVAFGVVMFEGFCNASATYLALMGQMEYILNDKRGQCSDFLQSVVNLTSSDHRPTAVLLGATLSVIIAATQLTAFWGIRKRI